MSVNVDWYGDDQTIIYYKIEKTWKLDDLFIALSKGQQMIESVDHPVDSIFDFSESIGVPQQVLSSLRSVERSMPKNLRYTVAVGMNSFLTMMSKMMGNIAPAVTRNFRAADTLDQALAFLDEARKTQTNA